MARAMRPEHRRLVEQAGANAHQQLRDRLSESALARACFIEDRLVALWGVTGSLIAPFGLVWMVLTEEAMRHPVALLKEVRAQLAEIMVTKTELLATILESDCRAIRFAIFLGFHVAHEGGGAEGHDKPGRDALFTFLSRSAKHQIDVGNGIRVIPMGYHP